VLAADTKQPLAGIFDGLTGFSRVAVAVSGGSDSMALLRLAAAWRESPQGPRALTAVTVDHGLRAESAIEAERVKRWCAEIGVDHHTLLWTGDKPVSGIQAKARTARYDIMSNWCRENNIPMLMTGHTADDQAETVVMRQQRTSSDRSLAAIWPENEWLGVKLFRPLLNQRRQALRDYLTVLGQTWLDDPSNINEAFERVRIRNGMAAFNVVALQAVANAAQSRVQQADADLIRWLQRYLTVDDYAVLRLPRLQFAALTPSQQSDVLGWTACVAGDGQMAERASLDMLSQWIAEGRESRRSIGGAIVGARRHVVEVMREPGRIRAKFLTVGAEGFTEFDGRFRVIAPVGAWVGPMGPPPLLKRPKDVPALAFLALPVVRLADGSLHSAVKSEVQVISAQLCERFRV
jgi:tRNA(Ile)-lysidine synthase